MIKNHSTLLLRLIALVWLACLSPTAYGQWLSTANNKIVKDGNPITLRGVNFGNWLVWEGYMMNLDVAGKRAPHQIRAAIKDLLGNDEAKMVAFENNWRNSYITEADFQRAKAIGYNVVRVPFHYNQFWNGSTVKNDGFTWLDKAATWAQTYQIHVIFCLHAAPGYQNPAYHSDNPGTTVGFWSNWNNVNIAGQVWRHIANRYKANAWVAGYDLLNEPVLETNKTNLKQSYKDMTAQIRAVDGNHLIFAEGNYWGSDFYDMQEKWDSKLVFEDHYYGAQGEANPNPDIATRKNLANGIGVPLVTGEFGENTADWVRAARLDYETMNVGWLFWAWKRQATDRSIYSFTSTSGWDQITNYIRNGGTKPSVANVESWLNGICNQVKLANSTYVSSLQDRLRPGWPTGSTVWLQNSGRYVTSNNGTGPVTCNKTAVGTWEKFTIVDAGDWKIALRGNNGRYLNSQNGTAAMTCNSTAIGGWEAFEWVEVATGQIALKGFNGKFVSSEGGATTGMNCNRETVSGWEAFNWATTTPGRLAAVEESEDILLTVFPNPVKDKLTYRMPKGYTNHTFELFDALGKKQLHKEVSDQEEHSVYVGSLPKGLYIIHISSGDLHKVVKIKKN